MKALDMKTRTAMIRSQAKEYKRVKKKEKGVVLDSVVSLTGYHRSYAAYVLRKAPQEKEEGLKGVVRPFRRRRRRRYDGTIRALLKQVWIWMDYLCGKRLGPHLPDLIPKLVECGELRASATVLRKLARISPATIDRILAPEKALVALKGRARTKPGTLLKSQIPIRTFADWDEQRPGFVEMDLVAHDGGDANGDFIQTLDVTDVATGWTETQAVRNKAQVWVFQALKDIRSRLPFPLRGIDSDNGGEFINDQMLRYCRQEHLTFTRSRPYRKNDTCFVEQKNWSVVRRAVAYARYDSPEELALLNTLYTPLCLYTNFFQPSMKLVEKIRQGAHVTKHYDKAQTPAQRLLNSPVVDSKTQRALKAQYDQLNPVKLRRDIDLLQHRLLTLANLKTRKTTRAAYE